MRWESERSTRCLGAKGATRNTPVDEVRAASSAKGGVGEEEQSRLLCAPWVTLSRGSAGAFGLGWRNLCLALAHGRCCAALGQPKQQFALLQSPL